MSEAKVKRYIVRGIKDGTVIIDELVGSFGPKGTPNADLFIYHDTGDSLWIEGHRLRATPAAAIRFSVGMGKEQVRAVGKHLADIKRDLKKLMSCKTSRIVKSRP